MKNKLTLAQKIDSLKQSIELTASEKKAIYDMKMKKLSKVFQQYCKLGDLEMVKYFLTAPDLKFHANIYDFNSRAIESAFSSEKKRNL